ncbi:MAG: ribose 5-phosphate isomerase B [Deltaproteobacteria bacterium]|nr:ribose 5-phosphate isomerase B [Deltaproteobacteria bacterium]
MKTPRRSAPCKTSSISSTPAGREAATAASRQKIYVGCDHAAVAAKSVVVEELRALDFDVIDVGTDGAASVDYPDYAEKVARAVAAGEAPSGVLLCGSGIGMSIAANKIAGVRAALVHDVTGAELSRRHNDANVLVLGGGMLGDRLIRDIVRTWVQSEFEGGRHRLRVDKIRALERSGSDAETQRPVEPDGHQRR